MSSPILLCADSFSVRFPELIGLPEESLGAQEWLKVLSDAEEARAYLADHPSTPEAWVLGSDDVEAINLAAALKVDVQAGSAIQQDCAIFLVSGEGEEMHYRAQAAELDGILSPSRFACRYAEEKKAWLQWKKTEELPVGGQSGVAKQGVKQALLLPVLSASGGVGRSSIAVLAAMAAARAGQKTLLVDADFQFGDAAHMVSRLHGDGRTGSRLQTFEDVIAGTVRVDELLKDATDSRPAVLGALHAPEQAERCAEVFAAFLDEVSRVFDVVVVDTATWWSEVHGVLIDRATRVLYVLDQRPSAVQTALRALELCSRCGMATGAFSFVLNRCRRGALYGTADIAGALPGFPIAEVRDGGLEVEELAASGRAADLFAAYNAMAVSVEDLVHPMLPGAKATEEVPNVQAKRWRQVKRQRAGALRGRGDACPF